MHGGHLFSVRSARVIAGGRAVLAVFLLAATALDGLQDLHGSVLILLLANLVWSVGLLVATQNRAFIYRLARFQFAPPAIDFALYTSLIYLTGAADTPFFSPLILLTLAATIQWGARGAGMMGLLTLAAFAPAGWMAVFGPGATEAQSQTFVLRVGYLGILAVMLTAFGRHVERVVEELARLSDPLAEEGEGAGPPYRECLQHALRVLGAKRGLLLAEESDEPYTTMAVLTDEGFETQTLPPSAEDLLDPDVADDVFVFNRHTGACLVRRGRRTVSGPAQPIAASLQRRFPFEWAVVIPVTAGAIRLWLVVFDHEEPANEDFAIGAMVGAQVAVALERWQAHEALREAAAAEDRVRFARDLHDGVLQFLAGAGLQLDALARDDLPEQSRARVTTLRQAVADEQKELRGFITTLRPSRVEGGCPLETELTQLAERLSRYWSVEVGVEVLPSNLMAPDRVAYDLTRIVRESVANAVRHGQARRIRVSARAEEERLALRIDDDGRGFPFEGFASAEELERAGTAPRTLHERVRALQGRLAFQSSREGASVMIDVPLGSA